MKREDPSPEGSSSIGGQRDPHHDGPHQHARGHLLGRQARRQQVDPEQEGDFDTRVLCLHYYSDALGFEFGDNDDVYRIDQIKEWAISELDPLWLDGLRLQLFEMSGKMRVGRAGEKQMNTAQTRTLQS